MRCYAPFCKTTAETVSESAAVTLHEFPSDLNLRAAWLRALGRQDTPLPDPAVVCSQHFLNDDMYETETGSRQICAGAIPSTVQVCMICLETDNKLFLMSKHELQEAYQHLTGNPPCDLGNLKQALCVHCAQRLINFSRFRDKSLRAQALLMNLVQQHELITSLHIKKINRTKHQLKSNMTVTTMAPDYCDLHILEDIQRKSADTIDTDVVKTANDELMLVDEDMEVIHEDDHADCVKDEFVAPNEENSSDRSIKLETQLLDDAIFKALNRKASVSTQVAVTQDIFKCESAPCQCTLCLEEFVLAHANLRHLSTHLQSGAAADDPQQLSDDPQQLIDDPQQLSDDPQQLSDDPQQLSDEPPSRDLPPMSVALPARRATNNETKVPPAEEDDSHDEQVPANGIASEEVSCLATSQNKVHTTLNNPNLSSLQSETFCSNNDVNVPYNSSPANVERKLFLCDVCAKMFKKRRVLTNHIKYTHTEVMQLNCKVCQYKCKNKNALVRHMHVHTGDKPFACELCEYKCSCKYTLVRHMRSHTGDKPYACELCKFKFSQKCHLMRHMRTHTGDKPFACELCKYKCSHKSDLIIHMRTHTGDKPLDYELSKYKCSQKSDLVRHMRTHTGDKPFACELCKNKFSQKNSLIIHMRTHTGHKPFACELCKYKCSNKSNLVKHMRTHTGDKPYICKLCKYKCSQKCNLIIHMRTHTGDKPYICELCKFKSSHKNSLVSHMRTHTGEKPFICKLCKYKCSRKDALVGHMRTHTGDKPYNCKLCKYKCSRKYTLVGHMRTHTSDKPYNCKLCKYKCSRKYTLVRHMKTHTDDKPNTRWWF